MNKIMGKTSIFLKLLAILILCIFFGLILLVIVFQLPGDNAIRHVKESTYIFEMEGIYPQVSEYSYATLDNYTDALMLKKASYEGEKSALEKALMGYSSIKSKDYDNPVESLIDYYREDDSQIIDDKYPRYWHGYVVVLRPILMLYNYGQIRAINLYLEGLLTLIICALLIIKRKWMYVIPYIIIIILLNPYATACSLQFSSVFYIFSACALFMIIFNNRLRKNKNSYYYVFLILGAVTSYIDFFTYPIATWGIGLTIYLCLNRYESETADLKNIINLSVCWAIGYAGMWAGKWILTELLTDYNGIQDAIERVKYRSSSSIEEIDITIGSVIRANIVYLFSEPIITVWSALMPVVTVLDVFIRIKNGIKVNLWRILSFLLVAVSPFAWYAVVKNHSYIHNIFTHKDLVVTTFSLMCMTLGGLDSLMGKKINRY